MERFIYAASLVRVMTVAVLVLLSAAVSASALNVGPCTDDFNQYCSDVTPGGGRLVQCYEQNKNKMTADCVGWAESAKVSGQALRAACADMLDARCQSEQGDPFASIDCLQSNDVDLTPKCVQKLNEFKGRYPKPIQ